MRVLVTGATGYVGKYVSACLRFAGHEVVGLTRDAASPRARELALLEVQPVEGVLEDPDSFRVHVQWAQAVVHCALDEGDSLASDRKLYRSVAALEAVDGLRRHVVYTSGCSVYGAREHDPVLTESTPVDPSTWRAQSEGELVATGLRHTILRPGFVYGGDGRRSVVGQWFAEAGQGRAVFYGDTAKRWSWVHVYDLARAFALSLQHPPASGGQVYCLGDGEPAAALATMEACARVAGHTGAIETKPMDQGPDSLSVFDHDEVIDSEKARAELGWSALQPNLLTRVEALYSAWSAANQAR